MTDMWPNGRLNTRAHDFDLEHELRNQRDMKAAWKKQGRGKSCLAELDRNIANIISEQKRRKR